MQIFIKTLTGKTLVLDVEPSITIENIKYKIEELEGVPKEQQRLISGKELIDNNKTLSDYNICNLSNINLSLIIKSAILIHVKSLLNKLNLEFYANSDNTINDLKKIIEKNKVIKIN